MCMLQHRHVFSKAFMMSEVVALFSSDSADNLCFFPFLLFRSKLLHVIHWFLPCAEFLAPYSIAIWYPH